ncbi:MAG: hypothetical protein O2894_12140 [Planctomycetota bacterium]|nr:hypothetical protein [Planctomycetota bacterium]
MNGIRLARPVTDPTEALAAAQALVESLVGRTQSDLRLIAKSTVRSLRLIAADHPWAVDEFRELIGVSVGMQSQEMVGRAILLAEDEVASQGARSVVIGAALLRLGEHDSALIVLRPYLSDPEVEWYARLAAISGCDDSETCPSRILSIVLPLPSTNCPDEVRVGLGIRLNRLGFGAEAARVLGPIADLKHASAHLIRELGRAYLAMDDGLTGLALLDRACKSDDAELGWQGDRAVALLMLGEYKRAEVALDLALKQHPAPPELLLRRASLHLRLGRKVAARQDLDAAIAMGSMSLMSWCSYAILGTELGDVDRVQQARAAVVEQYSDALPAFERAVESGHLRQRDLHLR